MKHGNVVGPVIVTPGCCTVLIATIAVRYQTAPMSMGTGVLPTLDRQFLIAAAA